MLDRLRGNAVAFGGPGLPWPHPPSAHPFVGMDGAKIGRELTIVPRAVDWDDFRDQCALSWLPRH
jgi:hypothetical protein